MALVETRQDGGIGTIVLNDAVRRNALGRALCADLDAAIVAMAEAGARVVILRAPAGTKVWSAGYDVTELDDVTRDALGSSDGIRTVVRRLEDLPVPVIALLEGGVWGAACELACACDILVATPEVTLAITPAKLGLVFNVSGLLGLLNRMPLGIVKEMAFTAQPLSAERAERLGVINAVVPAAEIEGFVRDLAARITALAPLSLGVMKEELRLMTDVVAFGPRTIERMQRLRRGVWASADYAEGMTAFRERRPPVFKGE